MGRNPVWRFLEGLLEGFFGVKEGRKWAGEFLLFEGHENYEGFSENFGRFGGFYLSRRLIANLSPVRSDEIR